MAAPDSSVTKPEVSNRLMRPLMRHLDQAVGVDVVDGALRRANRASRKLSGYLAGDLVEQILENPELELTLGGKRTEAAVLFADIVGFTPRCETMPPEDVVDELNLYFSHLDPALEQHGAVLDQRMGDGIMAVMVPRPEESSEHLRGRAVACGLELLVALNACNEQLVERGAAPMQIRVGLSYGPLVQSNMGSSLKLEYTVIGDIVNLAARLEGEATPGHLLVQATAMPPGPDEQGRWIRMDERTIQVTGKREPVDVVELRPLGRQPESV